MKRVIATLGGVVVAVIGIGYALFVNTTLGMPADAVAGGLLGAAASCGIVVGLMRWTEGSWPWQD